MCAGYGDPYRYGWYGRYSDPYLPVPVPANGVTRTTQVWVLCASGTGPVPRGTGPVPKVQSTHTWAVRVTPLVGMGTVRYGSPYLPYHPYRYGSPYLAHTSACG